MYFRLRRRDRSRLRGPSRAQSLKNNWLRIDVTSHAYAKRAAYVPTFVLHSNDTSDLQFIIRRCKLNLTQKQKVERFDSSKPADEIKNTIPVSQWKRIFSGITVRSRVEAREHFSTVSKTNKLWNNKDVRYLIFNEIFPITIGYIREILLTLMYISE